MYPWLPFKTNQYYIECAGREGPSSPIAPRPYVQALCAPLNCNQFPYSSLVAIPRGAAREPSISEGGNCLNEFRCWPAMSREQKDLLQAPKLGQII
jgi:hypothetical protein